MGTIAHEVHKWRQTVNGRILDHNGDLGYDYDECVDVPNSWRRYQGLPESYGNANQLNYSGDCTFTVNMPSNRPSPGDIVLWSGYPADPNYGHTAVALWGCNLNKIRAQSQNWPDGSDCHTVIFTYQGVWGWWTPKPISAPSSKP